ncbi:MAG: divergent polysaccharide deacetylase family protein [Myxococcales bacterium FL481]|nr:MAG: divergent polysaccharide deacetylase family protein [Myxococcales bacterium FL481]
MAVGGSAPARRALQKGRLMPTLGPKMAVLAWGLLVGSVSIAGDRPADRPHDRGTRGTAEEPGTSQSTGRGQDVRISWARARGHVSIVIDDVGRERLLQERLRHLPYRLTFSVLPDAVETHRAQRRLLQDPQRPREIWLHLPMEPLGATAMVRGPEQRENFLLATDSPAALRSKIERALRQVPTAVGVNNHMGSRLTADAAAMLVVMGVLRERGLYFLDSRTTADTVAESVAHEMGVPVGHRHVFLDHNPSRSAIDNALQDAAEVSLTEPTVVIGHPRKHLVDALTDWLPTLQARGIGVYPLSELLRQGGTTRESRLRVTTPSYTSKSSRP